MPREQRYRLELREAERQRDALAQRVDLLTRREVERIAGEHLAQGADLLGISGNSLDAYINEETGEVDADRVREDARILLADRPGLRKNAAAFDPSQGLGGRPPQKTGPQSLGQVILMS
ncbi:MAG: hypothetical protein JST91_00835 [Actinobacteria bacterium]|nr:hypothetical protein [Actinomycetota bacterium]